MFHCDRTCYQLSITTPGPRTGTSAPLLSPANGPSHSAPPSLYLVLPIFFPKSLFSSPAQHNPHLTTPHHTATTRPRAKSRGSKRAPALTGDNAYPYSLCGPATVRTMWTRAIANDTDVCVQPQHAKACMDGMPDEILLNVFQYLPTMESRR